MTRERGIRAASFSPDAAVADEPEAVLGDRRAQEVAAEFLSPGPVGGRHPDVGVEVEPVEMRLPGGDGGAADPGEGEGFLRERVRRGHIFVARRPAAAWPPQATGQMLYRDGIVRYGEASGRHPELSLLRS